MGYRENNWKRYLNLISFNVNLIIILFFLGLKSLIKGSKPDALIASSPQLPATFICLIYSKIFRIKFVSEIRDLWPQVLIDLGGKKQTSLIIRVFKFMERTIYIHSDCVVVLSQGAIKYVKERGAKLVKWLPNGPDLNQFKFSNLPSEKDGFNNKRSFNLIYAGAHGKANGLESVIEAARLLKTKFLKIKSII